ncbi:hypothetical protein D3C72_138050 [compost metagenome]
MLNRRFVAPLAAFALTSGLMLAGCQLFPGSTGNPNPTPSATTSTEPIPEADLEACEHLNNGPSVAVTASLSAQGAPQVSEGHKRYDITLIADNAQYSGKVLYNSKEEADYVFFFDQDVKLSVRDAEDAVVEIEATASFSSACGTVKARYELPLSVGLYTLHLGPTAASTVSLVVEESAHEDHDHAH